MSENYNSISLFRYQGKEYRLYKRSTKPLSPYCFRVQIDGVRKIVTTGTPDISFAKVAAKKRLAQLLGEQTAQSEPVEGEIPTFGAVVSHFLTGDQHVARKTAKTYVSSLYLILKEVHGWTRQQAAAQKISVLSDITIRNFQAKRQGGSTVNYVDPFKGNTTINSIVRQARSLFSRRAQAAYKDVDMRMPSGLKKFLSVPYLKEISHRYSDNPIPQEQINAMNAALPALKEHDERLYAIHLMIRLMGLRDSEIFRARRDWIIERGGQKYLVINRRDGQQAPKRSDGEVPIPDALMEFIDKNHGKYIIEGKSMTARKNLIYTDHNRFVKKFITGRSKGNHELRKWAGSIVATKTDSFDRAAQFLRCSPEVAKEHYLAFLSPPEVLSTDDL